MTETSLQIVIKAKDEASKMLQGFSANLESAKSHLEGAKTASMAFAGTLAGLGASVVGFGTMAVKAAGEAQAKIASMDATLKAIGGSALNVRGQILEAAKGFTKLGLDDETAAQSMALLYQRTNDVGQAMKLTALAADLARAKNLDLSEATKLVNMAMSGSGRALLQYGISIKDSATPLEALGILQSKVGGQAEAFANSFQGQMQVLNETWQNFLETVGDKFLPILTRMIQRLIPFIENTLPQWIEKIKEISLWLEKHRFVLAMVAGAIIGALVPAIYAAVVAFGALTLSLAPYLLIGAAVAAVIYGIYYAIKNWEGILNYVVGLWNQIKDFLYNNWQTILTLFFPFVYGIIQIVKNWEAIKTYIFNLWTGIKDFCAAIWNSIAAIIQTFIGTIQEIWAKAKEVLLGAWNALWLPIQDATNSAMEAIKAPIENAIGWIQNKINWISNSVASARNAASNFVGGAVSGVGNLLGLAEGGIVTRPTLAMVGEAGAEAVIPLKNITRLGGMGGNVYYNNSVQVLGGTYLSQDVAEKIGDMIIAKLKANIRI